MLIGNIRNRANATEAVVGYFTASAVSTQRYWLDRQDATGTPPGLFAALNGRPPSPEPDNNPGFSGLNSNRVPTAVCTDDGRTPAKPEGWQD